MKLRFKSLITGILCASMLSACSPSTPETNTQDTTSSNVQTTSEQTTSAPASSNKQKITVWAWDPNFNIAIMQNAADRYTKINPDVEFDIVEMAKADVEQKLHTTLASKTTEGLPDIVLIEDYNSQKYLQSYPGSFADLTNSFDYSKFAPYKVSLMTLENKVYGVPFDSGVSALFYRSDILEEAGYKKEDLQDVTWNRLIEIGKDVKSKTGKAILGFEKSDGGLMRIMLQSAGTWYFDESGKADLANNDILKQAMQTYKDIVDADIIIPTSGWDEWVSAFNKGDTASVATGVWILGSIKAASDQSGKWTVAPTPKLDDAKSVNASNLGGSSWYILENGKNKDAAIKFMQEIFAKDVDFYQDILTKNGAVGTFLPAQEGAAYTAEDPFFGGQKIFQDISGYMKNIPAINYGMYTYEADAAIMGQINDFVGGKSLDECLKNAQTQLDSQIQ